MSLMLNSFCIWTCESCESAKKFLGFFESLWLNVCHEVASLIQTFVCCEKLCELHEYNPSCHWIWCKVNHPLLMTCFYWLNPIVEECRINEPNEQLEDDINMFGVGTFVEESFTSTCYWRIVFV
jgi:hypothetical protein